MPGRRPSPASLVRRLPRRSPVRASIEPPLRLTRELVAAVPEGHRSPRSRCTFNQRLQCPTDDQRSSASRRNTTYRACHGSPKPTQRFRLSHTSGRGTTDAFATISSGPSAVAAIIPWPCPLRSSEVSGVNQISAAPGIRLDSLAPRYVEEQHGTYLQHLNAQVENPKNLNIALTGRYGAGKSSILDEFERTHKADTLRLSISTLDPSHVKEGLTNRIQKELVKQLLYQASPKLLRYSRFARISPLRPLRAFVQSVALLGVIGALVAFLGWLPAIAGSGPEHSFWVRLGSWLAFGTLVAISLTVLRLTVLKRREISDLSAAGAAIKLTSKDGGTYFDEYLDEIVHFFDTELPRYVLFEDLDRFDDPHIFEALRELNTLLNNTHRRNSVGRPLRSNTEAEQSGPKLPVQFIYAVKDSLFERLGADTNIAGQDVVAAETVRANRTKFFEVVIPVVPFISHRNARELLTDLLAERAIDLDRQLVDLVARHSTDMRLLRNICNEYQIFAARLLEGGKIAPGLTPTNLFALVTYKNFHLEDFEQISRRNSDLDRLYDASRRLVTSAIAHCEGKQRTLKSGQALARSQQSLAKELGDRLLTIAQATANASGAQSAQILMDGKALSPDEVTQVEAWRSMSDVGKVSLHVHQRPYNHLVSVDFDVEQLRSLFPEAFEADKWRQIDGRDPEDLVRTLDRDIDLLRGADFAKLARNDRFQTTPTATGQTEARGSMPFGELIESTLTSQLAQELVKQGYIDRNFSLYAAQFYGHFTGLDVATFLVHSVQNNAMDIHYGFESPDSIQNLLAEAPAGFTRTVSALNIQIVDSLLSTEHPGATDVARLLVDAPSRDTKQFLQAFLNADAGPERLVRLLSAQGWRDVFRYLVSDEGVPADRRPEYVDAAMAGADPNTSYRLGAPFRDLVVEHYQSMTAITRDGRATLVVATLLDTAEVVLPTLAPVAPRLRNELVRRHRYALTAANLRVALDTKGAVSLDVVRGDNKVYAYCYANPSQYLAAVADDAGTAHSIESSSTLAAVVTDAHDRWDEGVLADVLATAAPDSRLADLEDVPETTWPTLASARLFQPTLRNVAAYHRSIGEIDHALAQLLTATQSVEAEDEDEATRQSIAIAIVNAGSVLPDAKLRVQLAASLGLTHRIDPSSVAPERGDLLALLLKHDLVEDAREVFLHFRPAGWTTVESGIAESNGFQDFFDAEIATGFIPNLLTSPNVPSQVRSTIFEDLDTFVPGDDAAALRAVAEHARRAHRTLPANQLHRMAAANVDPALLVPLIARSSSPATELVDVLAQLPEPYSYVATRAKTEFDTPDDDSHRKLLDLLQNGGIVVKHHKRRGRPQRRVTLA